MDSMNAVRETAVIAIPDEHREAASRYIDAIVSRDPDATLGPAYLEWRTEELWNRFLSDYTSIATGAYAKHGRDAVRIALGRL